MKLAMAQLLCITQKIFGTLGQPLRPKEMYHMTTQPLRVLVYIVIWEPTGVATVPLTITGI